jgi:hypothetical protein
MKRTTTLIVGEAGALNGRYTFRTTDEKDAVEQLIAKLFDGNGSVIFERDGMYRIQGDDRQAVAIVK